MQGVAEDHAYTEAVGDFQTAYGRLAAATPTLLVTNLKLCANIEGLHLAYIVASAEYPTRALVYSDGVGPWVAHELQRIGAFFEQQFRLVFALPSYIRADLPVLDRRTPGMPDRRATYRGGRRASDVPLLVPRFERK